MSTGIDGLTPHHPIVADASHRLPLARFRCTHPTPQQTTTSGTMAGKAAANVPLLAQDSDSEEEDEEIAFGAAAVRLGSCSCSVG